MYDELKKALNTYDIEKIEKEQIIIATEQILNILEKDDVTNEEKELIDKYAENKMIAKYTEIIAKEHSKLENVMRIRSLLKKRQPEVYKKRGVFLQINKALNNQLKEDEGNHNISVDEYDKLLATLYSIIDIGSRTIIAIYTKTSISL